MTRPLFSKMSCFLDRIVGERGAAHTLVEGFGREDGRRLGTCTYKTKIPRQNIRIELTNRSGPRKKYVS